MKAALLVCAVLAGQALPPSAGRLVDIGGRTLHINCSGSGTPTVVLVGGAVLPSAA